MVHFEEVAHYRPVRRGITFKFVIASDRKERGNLVIFKRGSASVASLPRNDIVAQSPKGDLLGEISIMLG